MSIIAQTTQTVGTMLNTVNTVANSISRSINSAASGLDMLDTFVGDAKKRQLIDSKYSMKEYASLARLRHQTDAARVRAQLKAELQSNPALLAEYNAVESEYNELETAINAELNAL